MRYALAIDQGTSSTRAVVIDRDGRVVSIAQQEHRQIHPRPGWVEHDPVEIWQRCLAVLERALDDAGLTAAQIACVGIANQRETVVVWDRASGEPIHNALVWQDTRTDRRVAELARDGGRDRFRAVTGLPLSTYFAGPKIGWILDHVDGARDRAERGQLACGTIDSWLIWKLTGGVHGGRHLTDVTNASRTLLMDLRSLRWDEQTAAAIGVPRVLLPEIRPSSGVYGEVRCGVLRGVPIAAALGDQQAAMLGQACLAAGSAKNTYGTGNFLLVNVGETPPRASRALLSTVCYQLGDAPAVYALEGSVAVTGALVGWLRDRLGLIRSAAEIEPLAASVPDNGGLYIVPAFSGLYAPYWRPDARGVFVGLTGYVTAAHVARAALEATAFQSADIVAAIRAEHGLELRELRVDGGMTANNLLLQIQADLLGIPVLRGAVTEASALGAAYAAGLATGMWSDPGALARNWTVERRFTPTLDAGTRAAMFDRWHRAVERSLDWA